MEIRPYEKNQKKHPKKQIEQVANSIKEFGMNQPIVVDKQGVIIVGHGRYEALKLLKWEIKPEYIKVVDLTEKAIIGSSKQEDIVLDLFLGSGSTLIAAQKTGRICYGMELDPKYVDVIVQRYVDYTGNNKIKLNGEEIIWQK